MKICRVATVPFFLQHHLRSQIIVTLAAGHSVTIISSDGPEVKELIKINDIKFEKINIARQINPLQDIVALWKLFVFFRKNRFEIVHSTTPKAGMLCAIAGILAGVQIRLHTFTGQPWVELKGLKRNIAITGDWLTAHLNTKCYADSISQREFLIEIGIANRQKIAVIGSGSLAGVDLNRFNKRKYASEAEITRNELGVDSNTTVITFIGRLTRDKGVVELVDAFAKISSSKRKCVLLLVGPQEPERDPLPINTLNLIHNNDLIFEIGYTSKPEKFLAITDIFCLPSYREGFGNVVIEAAAMSVPTVGTDIVGLRDAIVNNKTGILVIPKNVESLFDGLESLISNPEMVLTMGANAEERARENYDSVQVNAKLLDEYGSLRQRYIQHE
jgi:glycosyltransferase involved in cell wall biosynthesis